MAGRNRFGKLKEHATKSFKFDQVKLMHQADENFVILELIRRGINQDKWDAYSKNIGACAVFTGIWLADSLRGRREIKAYMSKSEGRQTLTVKGIGANAELKETADNISNALLVRKLNLEVGLPRALNDLSALPTEGGSQYFFISCEGRSAANERLSHDVAYAHRDGGTFFDPNVGEYMAVDRYAFLFFQEWTGIYRDDESFEHANFSRYICFPVR